MASPPFSLSISSPANTDIAANFPTLDRSDKDVIQSWFLVSLNTQGRNNALWLDQVAGGIGLGSAPTVPSGQAVIYYDTDGELRMYRGNIGAVEGLGVPVGTVLAHAANNPPTGFLKCDGSQVSRTTYARLFAMIGTTYGSGNGSTTFNVPDLRGYVVAGFDASNATGRLNGGSPGCSASGLGNTGGEQNHTLSTGELASHNHSASSSSSSTSTSNSSGSVTITDNGHTHSITDPQHNHGITDGGHAHNIHAQNSGASAAQGGSQFINGGGINMGATDSTTTGITINNHSTGITVNSNTTGITASTSISTTTTTNTSTTTTTGNNGSNTAHNNVQPTIILYYVIKY
jgi:microcystin-dependent protein